MKTGFLYGANEIVIFFGFFAFMLAATEAGFRLGRKSETNIPDKTKSLVSTVEAAILGVLGLLLGFTISMAVSRFEVRKQLVLEEATAIGTSCLRTELHPAPEGSEIASLLHHTSMLGCNMGPRTMDPRQLLFPWIHWGLENSVGHYLDLSTVVLGFT